MTSNVLRRLIFSTTKPLSRTFHRTIIHPKEAYEGDGKTTLSILNNDMTYGLMVESYSQLGFRLNNGISVLGSVAVFPKTILSWQVHTIDDINEESLSLFKILEPKLDLLVLGYGNCKRTKEFDKTILEFARKYNVNIEVTPTQNACSVFNYMNAEARYVAAALIPPSTVSLTEAEILDDTKNFVAMEKSD